MKTFLAFAAALLIGAAALAAGLVSTINKTVLQNGLPFVSSPYTITGVQGPYVEALVPTATPLTMSDGIGNVQIANLQMLYFLSDNLDCTVGFYGNTAGTGAVVSGGSMNVQAGVPYEWDNSGGTGGGPAGANWLAMKITAGTTAQGAMSSGTATNIHVRSSLSQ